MTPSRSMLLAFVALVALSATAIFAEGYTLFLPVVQQPGAEESATTETTTTTATATPIVTTTATATPIVTTTATATPIVTTTATPTTTPVAGNPYSRPLEEERAVFLDLANAALLESGCTHFVYTYNDNVTAAAQAWSEAMADPTSGYEFGHAPEGWYEEHGAPEAGRENVAFGIGNAEMTFEWFMSSPGHRGNILACHSQFTTEIGLGIGEVAGAHTYWTLAFADYRTTP